LGQVLELIFEAEFGRSLACRARRRGLGLAPSKDQEKNTRYCDESSLDPNVVHHFASADGWVFLISLIHEECGKRKANDASKREAQGADTGCQRSLFVTEPLASYLGCAAVEKCLTEGGKDGTDASVLKFLCDIDEESEPAPGQAENGAHTERECKTLAWQEVDSHEVGWDEGGQEDQALGFYDAGRAIKEHSNDLSNGAETHHKELRGGHSSGETGLKKPSVRVEGIA
jgi:hypothetical protein